MAVECFFLLGGIRMRIGKLIDGRYEVVSYVSEGGMGQLFQVYDRKLHNSIRALKCLKQEYSAYRNYAQSEMNLLTNLNHRGLPKIYDYIQNQDSQADMIVMEWINGSNMETFLRQNHHIDFELIFQISLELIDALSYLHQQKPSIIHRDIKPSNVMLDEHGHIKLIDFGISKQYSKQKTANTMNFGTPGFASPEQLKGANIDCRTDLYSFGCLIYYLCTGCKMIPYNKLAVIDNLLKQELSFLPRTFRNILERCLQEDPNHRYNNATEVQQALNELEYIFEQYPSNNKKPPRPHSSLITFLSLHPQAGATTIATLISQQLSNNIHLKLIEFPSRTVRLEAYPYLQHEKNSRNETSAQNLRHYSVVQYDNIEYCMFQSESFPLIEQAIDEFNHIVSQNGQQRLQMIDVSSDWELSSIQELISRSKIVVLICDPTIVSCNSFLLNRNRALLRYMSEHQKACLWINNKDIAFAGRNAWLSTVKSDYPSVNLPSVDPKQLYQLMWNDRFMHPKQRSWKVIVKRLTPLITKMKLLAKPIR